MSNFLTSGQALVVSIALVLFLTTISNAQTDAE